MKDSKGNGHGPDLVPHFLSKDELVKKGHRLADVVREINGIAKKKQLLVSERDKLASELLEKQEIVEAPFLPLEPKKKPDIAEAKT